MDELKSFKQPLLISLAVHFAFALFLLVDWGFEQEQTKKVELPHVVASLVTDDPFKQQKQKDIAEKRKKWEAERKRKAEQERKRVAAEKKRVADQKQKEAEKKRKLAEQKRKEEAKRKAAEEKKKQEALALKKKEEARKKQEAEQKRLAEEKKKAEQIKAKQEAERLAKEELAKQEAELAKQEEERKRKEQEEKELKELEALEKELAELEKEKASKKQSEVNQKSNNKPLDQVVAIIKQSVISNWTIPPGSESEQVIWVWLFFLPDGDLRDVKVVKSSGNVALDRSVEKAAWSMGNIPEIRDLTTDNFNKLNKGYVFNFVPQSK
ncbi:cell envelope integrity protein TolA [Litoribrevibacter albus]|uniref:Cell envelope integrity protein TolA n=1 Tax=Litoribrevibacter albus TaxID=1473156 RepID=A0AA37W7D2_9GAMM|nr:cell envelope integrity protein TolA [Litoribrevibacter albus]GLQ31243.1 hypothetical protein GCM10007876_17220 [Litoribrevibacter albus]